MGIIYNSNLRKRRKLEKEIFLQISYM